MIFGLYNKRTKYQNIVTMSKKSPNSDEQNFTHKKGVGKNFSVFFCDSDF